MMTQNYKFSLRALSPVTQTALFSPLAIPVSAVMVSPLCPSEDDFLLVPPTLSLAYLISTAYFRHFKPLHRPTEDNNVASSSTSNNATIVGDESDALLSNTSGKKTPNPTTVTPVPSFTSLTIWIIAFNVLVACTFLADVAILTLSQTFHGYCQNILFYYNVASSTAWIFNLIGLYLERAKSGKWGALHYGFWFGETFLEGVAFGILIARFFGTQTALNFWERSHFSLFAIRFLFLVLLSSSLITNLRRSSRSPTSDEESAPLADGSTASSYGTFANGGDNVHKGSKKVDDGEKSAFADLRPKIKQLIPFLYPKRDLKLQLLVTVCFGLLVGARALNILIPIQMKKVVDSLSRDPVYFAWDQIIILYVLRFIQGQGGIDSLRGYLWIPISQYTTREISVKVLSHLHSLSLEYHINRKTGEVLRIVDRGTSSVQNVLQGVIFQLLPAVSDALIGVFYFTFAYGWSFGLVIFVVIIFYVTFTVGLTERRTKFSRETNQLDQDARAKAVDSLLNYETVKYYTAEEYEIGRYADAIEKYQKQSYKSANTSNLLALSQNAVINGGMMAGSLLLAWEVWRGQLTVGDYVFFGQYIMQLFGPLGILGWIYASMQRSLVDMEKMLELLNVEPSVKDPPDNKTLVVKEGNIVFDDVSFWYDPRHQALHNISFTIPKGATVALVGPSGGGKSTILRLLFRFYDVTSGRILIDNQDIRSVTQRSLRQSIGVVPQDTNLFNDTIFFNIKYGKFDATDEDVYSAAKAAHIHDKIIDFPDGYESKVGERGLKLSGGEKQRVAIARTLLKNPPIVFLDEATSALDSTTERQIQNALATMTKDRTTIVIAHRLSTIVNADLILCIKNGQVVESGTHDELIQSGRDGTSEGVYYEMYQKQSREQTENIAILTDATSQVSDDDSDITQGGEPEQKGTPRENGAHEGRPGESGAQEGGPGESGAHEDGPGKDGAREGGSGESGARESGESRRRRGPGRESGPPESRDDE